MSTPGSSGFNIANIFKSSPPAAAPAAPAKPMDVANPGAGAGTDPSNPLPAPKPAEDPPVNPLDTFKDMFTITEDDRKKAPADPFADPLLNFDPKKFGEAATKMNFAKAVNPELAQKALSGDANALMQVINSAAQSSFVASAQVLSGILEQAISKNNGRLNATLDSKFRNMQLGYTSPENPALKHPAAQPLVEAIKATIAAKNPQLSPSEVTKQAENYFGVLSESFTKAGAPPAKGDSSEAMDWTKFLEQ